MDVEIVKNIKYNLVQHNSAQSLKYLYSTMLLKNNIRKYYVQCKIIYI